VGAVDVVAEEGADTSTEELPRLVRAQIKTTISTTGRPMNINIAINPKPIINKPPDIMANFSFYHLMN
jgi:hypothetical protein